MKSSINSDLEFVYLKWLLNNLNHITKLHIYLRRQGVWRTGQIIWKSVIDANFIRQYCLPDKIINLKYFHFYIGRKYELSLVDIENIINSFKNDPFFISHQWTNIKCLYDQNVSYQHIFSSNFNKPQLSDSLLYDILLRKCFSSNYFLLYLVLSHIRMIGQILDIFGLILIHLFIYFSINWINYVRMFPLSQFVQVNIFLNHFWSRKN